MLSTHHLHRRDAGHNRLQGIDVQFAPGRLHGLIGPNGSGKSSLLAALAGDLLPTEGRVAWQGQDLAHLAPRHLARLRAVLPQQLPASLPYRVSDVLALGRLPYAGEARQTRATAVRAAAEQTELQPLLARRYDALSGGQQARVQLARVLVQLHGQPAPGLLLLDEPTAYFDPRWQHACLALAQAQARAGHVVICVLHDLNLASQYADRLHLMDGGRLRQSGAPEAVLNSPWLDRAYDMAFDRVADPQHPAGVMLRGRPDFAFAQAAHQNGAQF